MRKPRHARWRIGIAALALAVIAAGCGDDGDSDTATDATGGTGTGATSGATTTAANTPVAGGSMTFLMHTEIKTLDSIGAGGSALSGEPSRLFAIYDSLVSLDNGTNVMEFRIAQSLDTADAGLTWTLKLKPGVKFSDGTAYDAASVKSNWDRHAVPENASPSLGLTRTFKSVEVVDATTLKITLLTANGQFPRVLSASSLNYNGSPTAIAAKGKDYGSSPVGAGAFMFKDWVRDAKLTLVKNPTFYDAPRPYLDTLVFQVVADENQRIDGIAQGQGDAAYIQSLAGQKKAKDSSLTLSSIPGMANNGVSFNLAKAPTDDVRVRKAIYQAVDPNQLNAAVFDGLAEVGDSWLPKDHPFYEAAATVPKFNLTEAQAGLDAYLKEKGVTEITVPVLLTDSGTNPKAGEFLKATLEKLKGLKIDLKLVPQAQLTTDIRNKNFTMVSYAMLGADPEPNLVETFYSKGTRNLFGVNNPTLDTALLASRGTQDSAARKAAFSTAQKELSKDVPMIIYPRGRTAVGSKGTRVQGLLLIEDGGPRFDKAWIKK